MRTTVSADSGRHSVNPVKAAAMAFAGMAFAAFIGTAQAQPAPKYPVKPVRMLSGAFGGPADNLARIIGPQALRHVGAAGGG